MLLSATSRSKAKRCRLISSGEPSVADMVAKPPSASSSDTDAQSSVSMSLTRVAVRANARTGWPAARVTMSRAWTQCESRMPPSSVARVPRQGTS